MNVLEIPFVEKVGVYRESNNNLSLGFKEDLLNHVQSIHASAQFLLAETASGEALSLEFPQYLGKVVPVLRDSNIKYKKPALKTISALATVSVEVKEKFIAQFEKKGRGSIEVQVEVKDDAGTLCAQATFNWFVQGI